MELAYEPASYDAALFVPVYAAQAGEVASAIEMPSGCSVVIDHGPHGWATRYSQLSKLLVTPCLPRLRRRQYVRAGEVIGYAAKAPVQIRFELWQWRGHDGFVPVDPQPRLAAWTIRDPAGELPLHREAA